MITEFKNSLNSFLMSYGFYIALALAVVILAIIIAYVTFILRKRNKNKEVKTPLLSNDESSWTKALGGKDNIISSTPNMSRLVVVLKDYSLVDKETLKNLGVTNIIKTSDKLTLVIPSKADIVNDLINK